jgi:hypothetical protein
MKNQDSEMVVLFITGTVITFLCGLLLGTLTGVDKTQKTALQNGNAYWFVNTNTINSPTPVFTWRTTINY